MKQHLRYDDVPHTRLPLALADLHAALEPGSPVELQVRPGDDGVAARRSDALRDVVIGAGFDVVTTDVDRERKVVRVRATRARTLADTVSEGMRLLVCGLNPSIYSADRGVGFARPGNRFWPAMLAAGLVTEVRDARHALVHHGIGMTDLCKRATVASAELTAEEYREGAARVRRLVEWLQPTAVCFVGLEGWRTAIDRKATPGHQPEGFGRRPAYVMPSTSGLNAHSRLDDLVAHLRAAADLTSTGF